MFIERVWLLLFIISIVIFRMIDICLSEDIKIHDKYVAQYNETSCTLLKREIKIINETKYYVYDYQVLKGKMKDHILHEVPIAYYDMSCDNAIPCWTNEKTDTVQILHPSLTFIWPNIESRMLYDLSIYMKLLCIMMVAFMLLDFIFAL